MKRVLLIVLFILSSTILLFGQKTFENKKFGFAMQEPKDWFVVEKTEVVKNLENFELTEANMEKVLKDSRNNILLTAYTKYDPDEKEGLNPKIQIEVRANKAKDFQQFKSVTTQGANGLKQFFEVFEVTEQPSEIEVSGIKSLTFTVKFTIKMQDGTPLKVKSRVVSIPYKNYYFQVSMADGQVEEDNSKLFDQLIKSIKIGS